MSIRLTKAGQTRLWRRPRADARVARMRYAIALLAAGDYKERIEIRKDGLHLRGMSRRGVIVDGTKSGRACSSKAKDQVFNRKDDGNGIEVFKANGVWIENLTACNFLGEGNQIWWNGGDGSGTIGMGAWFGNYLSATTTFYRA